MSKKLKDYQVIDVVRGGTFYKVRHKVTNNIFAWKAFDCSAYSCEQIQNIVDEVITISETAADNLLRYYDTILHSPSRTLYFVLEYISWRSLDDLIATCRDTGKYVAEGFVWYMLYELARVCKALDEYRCVVLTKCISTTSVFVDDNGALRVNCFELSPAAVVAPDLMRQVGDVVHALCYLTAPGNESRYSDDLHDVVGFLVEERSARLRPDVVLYHPTVLANLEHSAGICKLDDILMMATLNSDVNKCDSLKAVELRSSCEPAPRSRHKVYGSPLYVNVSPNHMLCVDDEFVKPSARCLSPTLAALALELPGYVPRARQPPGGLAGAGATCNSPQRVTERTLSQQWMSRLVALRQREQSLNKRERDIISKEIVNSPGGKLIPYIDAPETEADIETNGITLPPVIQVQAANDDSKRQWVTRRHRRNSSLHKRKQRKSYEDLDSSLSADPGDGSVIVTAKRFTKDNMPRRSIFPDVATKKVHFTATNPFVESDESVTLTFYELENVDRDGYQVPKQHEHGKVSDVAKFKYLDLERATTEKRAAMQQWKHASPSKQAKTTHSTLADITNQANMRKTPSKTSLASKISLQSSSTGHSTSGKSGCSMESGQSQVSEGNVSDRTRSGGRYSVIEDTLVKKPKSRKSLLNFKTPFKFMTSTKI